MPRILISIGLALIIAGLFWQFGEKLGLGRLPGDIKVQRENVTFYFPIVTSLIISVALTLLFWLFSHFRR